MSELDIILNEEERKLLETVIPEFGGQMADLPDSISEKEIAEDDSRP